MRKVSFTVVAQTKVYIHCEFTVYKTVAERKPDHSWFTNTSQICDFLPEKHKPCTIILNTYCFRLRNSVWLTGSLKDR